MIATWVSAVMPPRSSLGECSPMYIGATNEAVPTARPSTPRAMPSGSSEEVSPGGDRRPGVDHAGDEQRPLAADPVGQVTGHRGAGDGAEQQRPGDPGLLAGAEVQLAA